MASDAFAYLNITLRYLTKLFVHTYSLFIYQDEDKNQSFRLILYVL